MVHNNHVVSNIDRTPTAYGKNERDISLPVYEAPHIMSFTDEDILEELGPAHAEISNYNRGGMG